MKIRSKGAEGVLLTSLSALLYGTLPVFAGFAYAAGSNAETFNFYKSVWALPVLAILLAARKQSLLLPWRMALWAAAAGVLGKGITSLLLYSSYNYVSSGVATTLHFMYPLFAALLGRIVFHTRLPGYKWATLLAATAAVCLFIDPADGRKGMIGVLCAVASGAVYAAYILVVDKSGASAVDPMVFAFYLAASGAIFSLIYGVGTGTLHFFPSAEAHLYTAGAAVCTSVLGAAFFQQGIRLLGGASAAFFSLLEPVASCVFGAVFLSERVGWRAAAGILLILASVMVMIWLDARRAGGRAGMEREKAP